MPNHDPSTQLLAHNGLNSVSISSIDTFSVQNDYNLLSLSDRSSFYPDADNGDSKITDEVSATATSSGNYNSTYGYGLVNAGAAVNRAAGQSNYNNVTDSSSNSWEANMINAPTAWNNGYTGKGVVVAVIDTGVDYNHVDLRNNIWVNTKEIAGNGIDDDGNGYVDDGNGWNFSDDNNNTLDDNGHGTHVAGTIAAEKNDYGVTGIAYDAKIMPIKALNASGSGSYLAIADGIYYAVNNGADVINLSLGGDYASNTLKSAIEYASNNGVIVVMAAGNSGNSSPQYPASYANNTGIAVGAVNQNNNIADFSNRAGSNEIAYVTAPGVKVYSTTPNNQYATYSGTSMATPHVAGVVALMLSANPSLTDTQVRQIITETAGNSTQSTSSSFDMSAAVGQVFTQLASNSIKSTTSNFNFSNFVGSNNATSSLDAISTLESTQIFVSPEIGSQFLYYQDAVMSSIQSTTDEKEKDDKNNNTDFSKLINQLTRQMEEYQKFFGNFSPKI